MTIKSIIVVRYVLLEQFVLQFLINFLVFSILFMNTDVELQEESTKKTEMQRVYQAPETQVLEGFGDCKWAFLFGFVIYPTFGSSFTCLILFLIFIWLAPNRIYDGFYYYFYSYLNPCPHFEKKWKAYFIYEICYLLGFILLFLTINGQDQI